VWSFYWCFEGKGTEMSLFPLDEHKVQIKFQKWDFLCFWWMIFPGNYSERLGRNLSEAERTVLEARFCIQMEYF